MTSDKEQTACCGLYCGDCIPSRRPLFEAAQKLRDELDQCRFSQYAQYKSKGNKTFNGFGTFREILEAILTLRCAKPCSQGGGRPDCPIRICAHAKGMEGCWQCAGFETCALLEPMAACHGDTLQHNLRTIRQLGVEHWAHQRGQHYVWPDSNGLSCGPGRRQGLHPEQHRIDFELLPWESPAPGVRIKKYQRNGQRLRLAEFTKEFVEPDWCVRGHAGYVLGGVLAVDFHGQDTIFVAGDGLFIPPGDEHRHKARAVTDAVTLVLVDE